MWTRGAELAQGVRLVGGFVVFAVIVLSFRATFGGKANRFEVPIIAGATAYIFYVGAALMAGAQWPEFLREHLFDGLAPAALVGLLVNSMPRENPEAAFPRIRRPVMILVVLFAAGALVFGLIAAAAVFASGSDGFVTPVGLCALAGGLLFPAAYVTAVEGERMGSPLWPRVEWWFGNRPEPVATPEPGGPGDAGAPAAADAEAGARPTVPGGDLPASLDASQDAGELAAPTNPMRGDPRAGAGGGSG